MNNTADLLITNARLVTLRTGSTPRRGPAAMRELSVIPNGSVAVTNGVITSVSNDAQPDIKAQHTINADERIVLPGFVDCHTHACWAGERLDEFQMKLEGADYLSILKAGGGIMSTVRSTRAASIEHLVERTVTHIKRMMAFGTTTAEVKSGYGLNTETELKMLDAIARANAQVEAQLVSTALIAHAVDNEQPDFFDCTINETLPAVAAAHPGIVIDAYCEEGAWPLNETRRLFERARDLGCALRIHTDQFNALGATRMAIELGAISVDHLEATTTKEDIDFIAQSDSIAIALPIAGIQTDDRYAPGRALIDAGAALAIATNYNPGSAPCPSVPFAIALACRKCGLTPAEAISAATINPARVLGLDKEVGSIEVGKRADLVIWDEKDERQLAFEFASIPAQTVICGGKVIEK